MASIARDKNGTRRILFVHPDGRRPTIRLGRVSQRDAETVARHIEALLASQIAGTPVPRTTAAWLGGIGEPLRRRLARVGLVSSREPQPEAEAVALGTFIDQYIAGRTDIKPRTRINLDQAKRHLLRFFGADRRMDNITPGDADDFRSDLMARLSENTARRHCGRAKQFFRAALRKRLIRENPFADMKGCGVKANASRFYFITREEAQQVLDACPDAQWRLLFALARFGGLRVPSESLGLRWGDVDWERNRITIHSPKTARHEGGESRQIPLFPELRPYLEEVFEQAEPGTEYVITRYRSDNANLRTQLQRIIHKAGLLPWPKLFQNLRSTRETELAESYPIHVVCSWVGHSPAVASKHYLQVRDADFDRASGGGAKSGAREAQNAAQHTAAENCRVLQETQKALEHQGLLPLVANPCCCVPPILVPPGGLEQPADSSGNQGCALQSGAGCGALAARADPELAAVVDAWPALPAAIKAGILATIRGGGA